MFADSEIKRIVLVEDEDSIFYSTKEYFDQHYEVQIVGEDILTASSIYLPQKKWQLFFCLGSKEALKTIVYQNYIYNKPVCMIITDLLMPDYDGYWLIDSLNYIGINICKVVLSAYKDAQTLDSLIGKGVFRVFSKSELFLQQNWTLNIAALENILEGVIETQKNLSQKTTVTVSRQKNRYVYLRWPTIENKLESLSLGSMSDQELETLRQQIKAEQEE